MDLLFAVCCTVFDGFTLECGQTRRHITRPFGCCMDNKCCCGCSRCCRTDHEEEQRYQPIEDTDDDTPPPHYIVEARRIAASRNQQRQQQENRHDASKSSGTPSMTRTPHNASAKMGSSHASQA